MHMRVVLLCLLSLPGLVIAQSKDPLVADGDVEWLRSEEPDRLDCPFRDDIDYEHGEIECGLIQVPENREVADSRSIELHYVRIAAQPDEGSDEEADGESGDGEDDVREDPVIYLTGGPGVQVAGYVERLKDHSILEHRDLYILEQRGIGNSGDFCPFFNDRNPAELNQETFEAQERASMKAAATCLEQARARGVDIRGYNTFENARDVRALRMALGLEQWNVWGISYGSVLGQALLKVDPEGIRAMVIDAIVPLDIEGLMQMPHWYERDLERLFSACDEQSDCAAAWPELESRYRAAIDAMREEPMTVSVPESVRYPSGEVHLFQDLVAGLPFGLLYEQSNHPALPAIMDALARAVEERDEAFFRALALADTSGGMGSSPGMGMAVRCLDHYVDARARRYPETLERYPGMTRAFASPAAVELAPKMCRDVGLAPRDPAPYALPDSDLPVLVVNGAWDPITPPPLARRVVDVLGNARYLEFPHAGHGPTRSVDCAGDLMNGFFDDPAADVDRDCVENGEEAAVYLDGVFPTRAPFRAVAMKETEPKRLGIHAAWAGVSLLLAAGGLLTLGFAWLGACINRSDRTPAGGARLLTFLGALAVIGHLAGMGAAAWATGEVSEGLFIAGFVSWAGWIAWLAPVALVLAVAGLVQLLRNREAVTRAGWIGLSLVALGVISLSLFTQIWDLWPF